MQVYLNNLIVAAITFPFLALAFTVPYMIYQYRKFGSIPAWRTFLVYLFIFYLLCAYYLVILPLPESRTAVVSYAQHPQLIPFFFIQDILGSVNVSADNPSTWINILRSPIVFETVFNILLLVPLGMFLRYYFKRNWWQTLLIGFSVTLFFEITQFSGLYGIYEHPYRLFDVDDLIANTFGAMVGYWLAGPLAKVLPRMTVLNQEARKQGVRVSLTRRFFALLIDLFIAGCGIFLVGMFLLFFGTESFSQGLVVGGITLFNFEEMLLYAFLFVMMPSITRGQTIGQKILKLVIVRFDAKPAAWYQFFARYGLLYLFVKIPEWLIGWLRQLSTSGQSEMSSLLSSVRSIEPFLELGILFAGFVWIVSILVRNLSDKRKGRIFAMLNEHISGTCIMSVEGANALRDRMNILDVADVIALEKQLVDEGISLYELMQEAGHNVSKAVMEYEGKSASVLVVCGSGNNGGDGWVVAGDLAAKGYSVSLITPKMPSDLAVEPARKTALEVFAEAQKEGSLLHVFVNPPDDLLREKFGSATVIVDAILGTGFEGNEVRDPYRKWITAMNEQQAVRPETYLIAVDVPSGFSAQTGGHATPCVSADLTITMLAYKPGLLVEGASDFCGEVRLAPLVESHPTS